MKNFINWKKSFPNFLDESNNPFFALQKEIEKVFKNFAGRSEPASFSKNIDKLMIQPSVDIVESDHSYKLEVELPGMGEENIKVFIKDNMLTIEGKKETSKKDENQDYISREIEYGYYKRKIFLPDYIDTESPKASFKKGMLWIEFQKKESATRNRREIKVEAVDK